MAKPPLILLCRVSASLKWGPPPACHEDDTSAQGMRHVGELDHVALDQKADLQTSRCPQLSCPGDRDLGEILQPKCKRPPEALSPAHVLYLPGNGSSLDPLLEKKRRGRGGGNGQARSPPTHKRLNGLLAVHWLCLSFPSHPCLPLTEVLEAWAPSDIRTTPEG